MEERGKKYVYVIGLLVAFVIIMYSWKSISVKNVQRQMEAQQTQIIEKSQQVMTEKTRYFLRLTTTTLVWAIRKEMLRDNYDQINEYLNQFVKEPHIKQVLVCRSDGMVVVATDKKLEGVAISSLYPKELIEKNEIEISGDQNGNILVISPIMGLNKKLGMLFMVYESEKIVFETTH